MAAKNKKSIPIPSSRNNKKAADKEKQLEKPTLIDLLLEALLGTQQTRRDT